MFIVDLCQKVINLTAVVSSTILTINSMWQLSRPVPVMPSCRHAAAYYVIQMKSKHFIHDGLWLTGVLDTCHGLERSTQTAFAFYYSVYRCNNNNCAYNLEQNSWQDLFCLFLSDLYNSTILHHWLYVATVVAWDLSGILQGGVNRMHGSNYRLRMKPV